MGVLWAAHDQTLGRDVAIKEVGLRTDLSPAQTPRLRERALREARAAARVTHPCAVTVYDIVEADGRPWIVMELLSPRTLADVLAEDGTLAPAAVARLGLDLLDALTAAHAAGVVHRDVKPGNVVFADGRAVLVDFGIATVGDDPTVTAAGILLGSPAFMAPERARGEEPTPASDLWSLGATLFSAVEGQPPFRRDGHLPTLAAVLTQDAPPAVHAGPLRPVLAALLAREPADRPTAEQAHALLVAAARDVPIEPEPGASVSVATMAMPALVFYPAVTDTVEAPPPTSSPLHVPRQRANRVGALTAAMLAPVAAFALAVALPMPWQHVAGPAPQRPVASSPTPVTTAVTRSSASGASRAGSPASRSTARTMGTPPARAGTVVVSWNPGPGDSSRHEKGPGATHGDDRDKTHDQSKDDDKSKGHGHGGRKD
jgi:serine/threonine protein kinase